MCKTKEVSNTAQKTLTQGVHHLGLTVPSLSETLAFFTEQLGYQVVGEKPEYPAAFISGGATMLTLWQVKDSDKQQPFDRHNTVGLHHVALKVENVQALTDLHDQLKVCAATEKNIEIEFAPESMGGGPVHHMMCLIPGGLRVEFIALPTTK
ncbi:MAG: catechol-2,3-dioxygenase [Flavobacteriales bacterium]|jgi:catechol-2,3-dioxygenase